MQLLISAAWARLEARLVCETVDDRHEYIFNVAEQWRIPLSQISGNPTAAPDLPEQRNSGLGALCLAANCALHLRKPAKHIFGIHQQLGNHWWRDLVHQIQLQLGPRLCHISIVKLEIWLLLQWRSNSWETIERGISRSWSSRFHQERAGSRPATKQLP